jgi:hypothetical protein
MRALRTPTLLVALLAAATSSCVGRGGREGPSDDAGIAEGRPTRTVVRVDNLGFSDVTVYVIRGGSQRIRLGIAGGNRTTVLVLPANLVQFPTPLRFLADPIGSNRTPISTEITVNPGDEVVLQIPPS